MKNIVLISFTVLLSIFFIQNSFSKSTIFKCLDEFGRPIFSQQATCDKPETVNYSSKKLEDKTKKRQEKARKQAKRKQKKQCEEAKSTYLSYKRAPFLTKVIYSDGKEIKVRLTKDEAKMAVADAQQEKEYWCKK